MKIFYIKYKLIEQTAPSRPLKHPSTYTSTSSS
jgi:hypothetical protein